MKKNNTKREEIVVKNNPLEQKYPLNKPKETNKKPKEKFKLILFTLIISLALSTGIYFYSKSLATSSISLVVIFVLLQLYYYIKERLKLSARIRKIEEVFPDFIELMASNLRAGMTVDSALLLSSRKEFSPLDEEIIVLGKDVITGKEIDHALKAMALRIDSDKVTKTINVINSGIRSGGNLAVLLEQTAVNMRERNFVEKRAASNVLMYIIFIFFAVAAGAPALFSLSSVLVEILTNILSNIPQIEVSSSIPFTLTKINISVAFVTYFSLIFLIVIDILASLLLGLVNKGDEKSGIKYIFPLITISVIVYFSLRIVLLKYLGDLIG